MTKPKEQLIDPDQLNAFQFVGFIETVSTIECFACKQADTLNDDSFEAMEYFYKEGWRLFQDQPYCKRCLKRMKK